ncbi:hypothetical protein [Devosia sp.]|nr:hypothetical protein [Devosia sp.]MBN9334638.1 hypothetical protein [Devosia sp.]
MGRIDFERIAGNNWCEYSQEHQDYQEQAAERDRSVASHMAQQGAHGV